MHPIVFHSDSFSISGYSLMMFLGAVAAVIALRVRVSGRTDELTFLLRFLFGIILFAWLGSRLGLVLSGSRTGFSWQLLSPLSGGHSLGGAAAAVLVYALVCVAWKKQTILLYLDVLMPSLLLGMAVVKIGCLLAGCCAGPVCPSWLGLRYPFGSHPYTRQYTAGLVHPPDCLLWVDPAKKQKVPLAPAHVRALAEDRPPSFLREHLLRHQMTAAELIQQAQSHPSLPVLPLPLFYILLSAVAWVAAEAVYRRSFHRLGVTAGFVMLFYAGLRLGLDGFLAGVPPAIWRLTLSQCLAVPVGLAGAALIGWARLNRQNTPAVLR